MAGVEGTKWVIEKKNIALRSYLAIYVAVVGTYLYLNPSLLPRFISFVTPTWINTEPEGSRERGGARENTKARKYKQTNERMKASEGERKKARKKE